MKINENIIGIRRSEQDRRQGAGRIAADAAAGLEEKFLSCRERSERSCQRPWR